jgi:hypothetical protein
MGGFEAGGGPGVTALGPLAGMWRGVYRKAAAAAEARLQALLAEHVYHLHGRRALYFWVDGGGAVLAPGAGGDAELPWAYVVEGWALYADAPGDAVLDLRIATSYATYPTATSICGGAPPTLAGALKATSTDLTGWTTFLPRGTVLRPVLQSAASVSRLSLTLYVRAV